MLFIATTATQLAKLKAEAKALSKSNGKKLTEAQEEVAIKHGYHHWKHVTVCAAKTVAKPPTKFELYGHLLNAEERILYAKASEIERDFMLHLAYKQTPEGQARFQTLSVSVTSSWKNTRRV